TSLGSGVIVAPDGTILTNEHVILRASRIHVTLADEREFDAKLVGADSDSDVAVLRVQAGGELPHVTLGTSSDLMIGETVIAIGNPFGLSHTVTTGVVSALGRAIHSDDKTYSDFIQTDASINPGNSGGPLLNIKGELIGINTAIYSRTGGSIGIGVAEGDDGLVVRRVRDGSPAARIGVQRGDRLLGLGGAPLDSLAAFRKKMIELRGARSTLLSIGRGPYQYNVQVALAR